MAGLNINSRQNSIHSSNKKYNVSLLLVIYLVFPLSAVLLALFFIYSEIYETIPLQLSEMFFNFSRKNSARGTFYCRRSKSIPKRERCSGTKLKHLISGRIIFFSSFVLLIG